MDSLFRRYYIPKLVVREVRLSEQQTLSEIIDGQQRITTVQEFFGNKFPLPPSLKDVDPVLAGAYYKDLGTDIRKFIDKSLKYQSDVIKNIDNPGCIQHQNIATEIFWRLQQGESLNYMEVAHAQLFSTARNFIVKYADDQTFDFSAYKPLDVNPDKVKFFSLLNVDNTRMKHLQFMARFLMIEEGGGYADLSDKKVEDFIDRYKQDDGIGNMSFEGRTEAKSVLRFLKAFHEIFKDDPMLDEKSGIRELSIEYFIISMYLLVRHATLQYVMDDKMRKVIRDFVYAFHSRWKESRDDDGDVQAFSNRRQQGGTDLEVRDQILRQTFFEFVRENGVELVEKDKQRAFTELQRIKIYRNARGFCQECVLEGKPESEARVGWSKYQADHIFPHALGGETSLDNAQLLCAVHNQKKGAKA